MKRYSTLCLLVISLSLGGCGWQCRCPESDVSRSIVAPRALLRTISTGFKFTEGPATDAAGNVYFTDQPNNRIMIYTVDGRIETFMQPAGRANGLYFDEQENLIACADEHNELWQIDIKTGMRKVLAHLYNGKRLNEPNDTWVRPKGGLYFTDPFHQRPWWKHHSPTQDVQGTFIFFCPMEHSSASSPTWRCPTASSARRTERRSMFPTAGPIKRMCMLLSQTGC